jgi:predicted O-methyltransferase YrrM
MLRESAESLLRAGLAPLASRRLAAARRDGFPLFLARPVETLVHDRLSTSEARASCAIEEQREMLVRRAGTVSVFARRPQDGAASPSELPQVRSVDLAWMATVGAMPLRWGRFLLALAGEREVAAALELGTGVGISSASVGVAGCAPRIVTIDKSPDMVRISRGLLDSVGVDALVVEGEIGEVLDAALEGLPALDLLIVDGDRDVEALARHLARLVPALSPAGVVVLDDLATPAPVRETFERAAASGEFSWAIDLGRLGVLVRGDEPAIRLDLARFVEPSRQTWRRARLRRSAR